MKLKEPMNDNLVSELSIMDEQDLDLRMEVINTHLNFLRENGDFHNSQMGKDILVAFGTFVTAASLLNIVCQQVSPDTAEIVRLLTYYCGIGISAFFGYIQYQKYLTSIKPYDDAIKEIKGQLKSYSDTNDDTNEVNLSSDTSKLEA